MRATPCPARGDHPPASPPCGIVPPRVSAFPPVESVDTVVIGAGVVGLACARALALAGREVLILEAEDAFGTLTSSRSSEVIHAGIYYPTGSLKAALCVPGKRALYEYARSHGVGHRNCGKLIVATADEDRKKLAAIHAQALANGVTDLEALTPAEVRALEPAVTCVAALLSPSTGIIDSHALMLSLLGDVENAGGVLAFYLGAPANIGTASGSIVAGAADYGQIILGGSGTVSLNGIIAGYLDPAFASANPALTEVQYNDVIVAPNAGAISGDFIATALLSNSSLYELNELIDGNTVDLRVVRTSASQTSTASNVVNTLDPFDSNIADRTNGIGSGGCGLASLSGGSCFNRFAANDSPGATQVMTDATPGEDPFAWLRTGVRRVGETAVWGRAVGVWGDTDGQGTIPGTDFSLGGAIAGVDHVFTPLLLAGLAGQWTTTDVNFKGNPDNADVESFEIGAYGSYGDTRLFVNANVSYIWHNFEVNRFTGGGTRANGKYDGDTISAYVEGGKIFEMESGLRLQPLVALSYSHLETDPYSETGIGALLDVLSADLTSFKTMIGGRFAYPIELDSGRKMVPEARIVWSHEFEDTFSTHIADVQGGAFVPQLVKGEEFARDSLTLGTGLTAPLSDATSVFFDYDAGLNTDVTTHSVSAGFRTRW